MLASPLGMLGNALTLQQNDTDYKERFVWKFESVLILHLIMKLE